MEYQKTIDGAYIRLAQRNVDTGMGVERTAAVLQGKVDVFQIETLWPLVGEIERLSGRAYQDDPGPLRIIADHLRAASLAIANGVLPSNVEAGYVVRRLVRRAVRHGHALGIRDNFCAHLSTSVVAILGDTYPELEEFGEQVCAALDQEETKFKQTLERGLRQYQKIATRLRTGGQTHLSGRDAFDLFETYGFPVSLTGEMAQEDGFTVDMEGFQAEYQRHKEMSRQGTQQKFKGGLADHAAETTNLHTATHLLHQALRQVLGPEVRQTGSNITVERLRFDFTYAERLSDDQLAAVESLVNAQIQRDLAVEMETMPLEAARRAGALAFFGEKYGDTVKVYTIGDFSKEVCGGPHAARTSALGGFRILKQEAVSQGVRRIKAVLEPGGEGVE
jgi:alanyl-tRNA synthetase